MATYSCFIHCYAIIGHLISRRRCTLALMLKHAHFKRLEHQLDTNRVWRRASESEAGWRFIQLRASEKVAASGLAASVKTLWLKVKQRSSGAGRGGAR